MITALERCSATTDQLVWFHEKFNFSAKMNIGAAHATGDCCSCSTTTWK